MPVEINLAIERCCEENLSGKNNDCAPRVAAVLVRIIFTVVVVVAIVNINQANDPHEMSKQGGGTDELSCLAESGTRAQRFPLLRHPRKRQIPILISRRTD